jgi:CheY-like chemotaxis protein
MDFDPQKNRRILVIDDNRAIHADFRKILTRRIAGEEDLMANESLLFGQTESRLARPLFQIDSAYQGRQGIEAVEHSLEENHPYAMAFVDVRMPPGLDGIETTAMIWKKYSDVQVVICTAYSDYSWGGMFEKLGYSDRLFVLKKPFQPFEVLQLAILMTAKWRLFAAIRGLPDAAKAELARRIGVGTSQSEAR